MAEHFRRAKIVRFIKIQRALISETKQQLEAAGINAEDYSVHRLAILERLMEEFDISESEVSN